MKKFTELEWDSNFFGYKVAQIDSACTELQEIKKSLLFLKESKFELVYLFSSTDFGKEMIIDEFSGIFVDKKTLYKKEKLNNFEVHEAVKPFQEIMPTDEMYELAIQSGVYSRFKTDSNFKLDKFKQLYRLWMENSTKKLIADEVLVCKINNKIAGMVTLAKKNGFGKIGIIAVGENTRGTGIGKKLMQSTENWAISNNFDSIHVVTQGENLTACKFYESNGYKVAEVQYLYHFWL